MRRAFLAVGVLSLLVVCGQEQLAGPEAQQAFLRARQQPSFHPESVLFIVDGKPVAGAEVVGSIDPKTIARIEVVKGAAAERLYGPRARIGAILLTTVSADLSKGRRPN